MNYQSKLKQICETHGKEQYFYKESLSELNKIEKLGGEIVHINDYHFLDYKIQMPKEADKREAIYLYLLQNLSFKASFSFNNKKDVLNVEHDE